MSLNKLCQISHKQLECSRYTKAKCSNCNSICQQKCQPIIWMKCSRNIMYTIISPYFQIFIQIRYRFRRLHEKVLTDIKVRCECYKWTPKGMPYTLVKDSPLSCRRLHIQFTFRHAFTGRTKAFIYTLQFTISRSLQLKLVNRVHSHTTFHQQPQHFRNWIC